MITFLEVGMNSKECIDQGILSRDEIEDEISDILANGGWGEVTGGGGGDGRWNIDIEIESENFDEVLKIIRSTLQKMKVPQSSWIQRYKPEKIRYGVYPGSTEN